MDPSLPLQQRIEGVAVGRACPVLLLQPDQPLEQLGKVLELHRHADFFLLGGEYEDRKASRAGRPRSGDGIAINRLGPVANQVAAADLVVGEFPIECRDDRFSLGTRGRHELGQLADGRIVVDPEQHPHLGDTVVVLGSNLQLNGRVGSHLPIGPGAGNRHSRRLVGHRGDRPPDGIAVGVTERVGELQLVSIRGGQSACERVASELGLGNGEHKRGLPARSATGQLDVLPALGDQPGSAEVFRGGECQFDGAAGQGGHFAGVAGGGFGLEQGIGWRSDRQSHGGHAGSAVHFQLPIPRAVVSGGDEEFHRPGRSFERRGVLAASVLVALLRRVHHQRRPVFLAFGPDSQLGTRRQHAFDANGELDLHTFGVTVAAVCGRDRLLDDLRRGERLDVGKRQQDSRESIAESFAAEPGIECHDEYDTESGHRGAANRQPVE